MNTNGTTYAVLIGINSYNDSRNLPNLEYAEKDCQDLYEVITNPETGIFCPENVTLLLGENANTNNVWELLFREIVTKPNNNDTVLVYFSGHGFILGEQNQKAYLGTYDVDIVNLLTKNRRAGLRMDDLYEDIFSISPAKCVLFILDSCHSGAFVPSITKGINTEISKIQTDEKLVDKGLFSQESGRVAIVSCPPDLPSYESKEFENSIFTHYLIRGLKGGAVEKETGEVTVDSLLTYIRNHAPSKQLPGRYGQDYGRIVIAKSSPGWEYENTQKQTIINVSENQLKSQINFQLNPLKNPFESYKFFIDRLIQFLKDDFPVSNIESRILEAVRYTCEADFVAVIRQTKNNWIVREQSSFKVEELSQETYIKNIIAQISPIISLRKNIFNPDYHGSYLIDEESDCAKVFMFVPLPSKSTKDLMIICGLSKNLYFLEEVYGRILGSLYSATYELTYVQNSLLEAAIIDDLKKTYGYVSLELYYRRFQLFCERLNEMIIHFQPILYLSPKRPYIYSWEALARDPQISSVPNDLFKAAELWGLQFMLELDIYFIRTAVVAYHKAYMNNPGRRRSEDIQELSVNVYPQSLMHEAYFQAVKEIIADEELIQPEKLILEISEKLPLPDNLEVFRKQLGTYVRDLKIGFAIDDFGVGHASVSRLIGLNPAHVKIDRDILQQVTINPNSIDIICRFVLDLVSEGRSHAPKVVIEGFDSTSPVTLGKLHKLGIRYVQGYIVGKAGNEIGRLDTQQRDYLKNIISSTD
ncbi:EAL domain-containing protein [Nostoc sp. UHCC 0870]|uniref:EAL domain-containing protein n=1 Tax=Nostoc sp. UHCC 0870 TaxID=2914041 RepID=UPI001EDF8C9F|nr:EAL domain-containing protein [Nostoc sp. UHCC 0870]UKO98777.1 EAL domain-containing protein [Nostoc sp. UHCC 0870]